MSAHREQRQEREVRLAIQRLLNAHLRTGEEEMPAETFWEDITLELSGAVLIDFSLVGSTVREVNFRSATFIGATRFDSVTFTEPAYFRWVDFTGRTYFDSASFTGGVNFESATFADVTFTSATFTGPAVFTSATFTGLADFKTTTFAQGVPNEVANVLSPRPLNRRSRVSNRDGFGSIDD